MHETSSVEGSSLAKLVCGTIKKKVMLAALVSQATAYTTLAVDDAIARWNEGRFAVLVDVRTQSEWQAGHLPNATFIESMNTNGDTSRLDGCQLCPVAV
tara:strand:+ start:432 stop:728 length:297 start_codon:yes stop_codon:yes gene_type:complete